MHLANLAARALADAFATYTEGGGSAARLVIYSAGSGVPADADVAISDQVTLASVTLNSPAFGAATDANPGALLTGDVDPLPEDASADATGTAAFARLIRSDDAVVAQFTVGVAPSGEVKLSTLSLVQGVAFQVTSYDVTMPES